MIGEHAHSLDIFLPRSLRPHIAVKIKMSENSHSKRVFGQIVEKVSSINGVCQRKPCTTGYGYRKKAYGYDWRYAETEPETSN